MIEIKDVSKSYTISDGDDQNELTVLDNVELTVQEGEFVSIIGPTGCGKSTLFEIIAGLVTPDNGVVKLDGSEINSPNQRIGMVFQDNSTFPWLTTQENVEFGLRMNDAPKDERRKKARKMINLVGLSGFEDAQPHELSGGMNQRVAIARTLVMDPDVILMDEPFGALDEQTRLVLGQELLDIWQKTGTTIIFITHNINESVQLSDRIAVMTARPGRFKEIFANELPRPRDDDMVRSEEFSELANLIWNELKPESLSGMNNPSTLNA